MGAKRGERRGVRARGSGGPCRLQVQVQLGVVSYHSGGVAHTWVLGERSCAAAGVST